MVDGVKTCKGCGLCKPYPEYQREARNLDGYAGKCRSCVRAYYKNRYAVPENLAAKRAAQSVYKKSERGKETQSAYSKTDKGRALKAKYRGSSPEKVAAWIAVCKAVKAGSLIRLPCWVCGSEEVEGHHPAYSMPLDVVWLCKEHHDELHFEYENGAST